MLGARLALLTFGLAVAVLAQYPPETQWRSIRTAHFEVLFPREIEADAQRLANALETMYRPLSESLGAALPRLSELEAPAVYRVRVVGRSSRERT